MVEAARLPILAVATLAFGGAALLLQKRLPQPGFALFIVFSFLLLIDGSEMVLRLDLHMPSYASTLAARHWPGPGWKGVRVLRQYVAQLLARSVSGAGSGTAGTF